MLAIRFNKSTKKEEFYYLNADTLSAFVASTAAFDLNNNQQVLDQYTTEEVKFVLSVTVIHGPSEKRAFVFPYRITSFAIVNDPEVTKEPFWAKCEEQSFFSYDEAQKAYKEFLQKYTGAVLEENVISRPDDLSSPDRPQASNEAAQDMLGMF
jgi:hypothetical protein